MSIQMSTSWAWQMSLLSLRLKSAVLLTAAAKAEKEAYWEFSFLCPTTNTQQSLENWVLNPMTCCMLSSLSSVLGKVMSRSCTILWPNKKTQLWTGSADTWIFPGIYCLQACRNASKYKAKFVPYPFVSQAFSLKKSPFFGRRVLTHWSPW